jgi:hypothetical protein
MRKRVGVRDRGIDLCTYSAGGPMLFQVSRGVMKASVCNIVSDQDPYKFPGSGSGFCSNEHFKMNLKENLQRMPIDWVLADDIK